MIGFPLALLRPFENIESELIMLQIRGILPTMGPKIDQFRLAVHGPKNHDFRANMLQMGHFELK